MTAARRPMRYLLCPAALLSCLLVPATAAAAKRAAAPPPFVVAVRPASGPLSSFFSIKGSPGRTRTAGTLTLTNRSARRITVLIDPVDAVTATTLGSAYQVRGLAIHGPSLWTRVARRRITLAPRARRAIAVKVSVPRGAAPGDYLSGISVEATTRASTRRTRSKLAISSVVRYVVGLETALPGARNPRIALTGVRVVREPAGVTFLVAASNTGNQILKGVRGAIAIDRGSHRVTQVQIPPGTFVTGTKIEYPVAAHAEAPQAGTTYRVRVRMRYGRRVATLDRNVSFGSHEAATQEQFGGPKATHGSGTPWWAIALGALALLGGGAAAARFRGRRPGGLAALEAALGGAAPAQPVSVTVISGEGAWRAPATRVLRPRLRSADKLLDGPGGALLIVSPDTSAQTAAGFARDLRNALSRELGSTSLAIGTASAAQPEPAAALIARAQADAA